MGRQEMHLLVFQVGGHFNFDVFTGFFHVVIPAGFQRATLVKIKSSMLTCGFFMAMTQANLEQRYESKT